MEIPVSDSKSIRWWDWPAALLLLAAIYVAATRLNATGWTDELNLVQTVALLGVIAGLALGKSTFSPGVVRFFALVYGTFVVFWQVGLTLGEGVLWSERMISIGNRLLIILDQIFQQKPVTDNLFFNLLMAGLFWTLSVYAGYNLTRYGNPWRAVIPAGFTMMIIHAYDPFLPVRTWFLAGFIFLALLIVARMHFIKLQYRWKINGTYLPPYAGIDSLRLGLITTVVLVLFAWTVPAVASAVPQAEQVWLNATRPWMDFRNNMSNVFYSLQASVGVVTDFYGENLPLGRGNPLSDTAIMTIESPPRAASNVRYYWRSRVYDTYEEGWSNTLENVDFVSPDEFNFNLPEYESRANSTFTITTLFPIQNLHTPSQPVWVSRPADAYYTVNSDGSVDMSHFKADPVLLAGDTYRVEASLTTASQKELREAGTDYPSWVTARYLQLPDTITPRTIELAEEIASGFDNPYDIAQAITDFLRTNLEYSDTVPGPPAGLEPIDWVLFDHKQAFCNYYASAEIVMLRSLGIPARLAVGYAEGERTALGGVEEIPDLVPGGVNIPQEIQIQSDTFTVRHRDAHAWPEVYFPNIGWVEFEPTVSQQPIIRPIGLVSETDQQPPPNPQNNELQDRAQRRLDELSAQGGSNQNVSIGGLTFNPTPIYVTLAIIIISSITLLVRRVRIQRGSPPVPVQLESSLQRVGIKSPQILIRWSRFASLSPLSRAYLELNRALLRLGQPPRMSDTPAERGNELVQILPVADNSIRSVLIPYQNSIYGNQPGDTEDAQRAGKEIRKLSYLARLQRFFARFQNPKGKSRSPDKS
jgi:transglutaminase-like putative cysteine protease